jgi:hypothetical protein
MLQQKWLSKPQEYWSFTRRTVNQVNHAQPHHLIAEMSVDFPICLFPASCLRLLNLHDIVDKLFCFITKRNQICLLSKLSSLYESLLPTTGAELSHFDDLALLCAACPLLYKVRLVNDGSSNLSVGSEKAYELVFLRFDGKTLANVNKRRKFVVEWIWSILVDSFKKTILERSSVGPSDKSGVAIALHQLKENVTWPAYFDVNGCQFPPQSTLQSVDKDLQAAISGCFCKGKVSSRAPTSDGKGGGSDSGAEVFGTSTAHEIEFDCGVTPMVSPSANKGYLDITAAGGAQAVVEQLTQQAFYHDQLRHVQRIPSRSARYAGLAPPALPPALWKRLQVMLGGGDRKGCEGVGAGPRGSGSGSGPSSDKQGSPGDPLQQTQSPQGPQFSLYLHQARAIDALRAGRHVAVSTSTASGKSVVYNVPVLEAVLRDPRTTALYLFPTKVSHIHRHRHPPGGSTYRGGSTYCSSSCCATITVVCPRKDFVFLYSMQFSTT